ncbi:hypothetical protein GH714_010914 [Hevea brasiliensis]|uniref:Retrotransposon gag domain-containing protein n=1 Tax=Hevea brasiliensis TaxID=3981 RepID=A0A6A6KSB4_HEVBR|nr:hypothetical protein GH714_010914 [Hevea brasiliensis]
MSDEGEVPPPVPRDLILDQAHMLRLERQQNAMHPQGQKDNIKMRIPTFRGTSSPEEHLKWVQRVDKIYEYQEYREAKKCKLAAIEFVDYANLWWENVKAQRHKDGLDNLQTWREMKRTIEKRFVPEYYKQELYIKLQSLCQGGMCVEDYVKEFEILMLRCDVREP